MYVEIGSRIKQLRVSRGLTQEQFGHRLGLSRAVISTYETETRYPPHDIIIRVAHVFRVPIDYLYGIEKQRTIDISGLNDRQCAVIESIVEDMRELNNFRNPK